jgi:NitT/TauT family transport system substrate-binding protein
MRPWLSTALLLLAGCGTPALKPVRIVTISGLTEPFPIYLCSALGHFRQEGVEVSLEAFPSGSRSVEALLGGSADVAFNSYMLAVQMSVTGRPLRSVFVSSVTSSALLVVSPEKAERIRQIEDLQGATIGVAGFGTAQQQVLTYTLRLHGVNIRKVKVVSYGTGPTAIAAIEHSKVDAGLINGSAFELLRRRAPTVRVLADPRTREGMKVLHGYETGANECLFSTPKWISQNPEIVRRMARAMLKTHVWIQAHTAEEILALLPPQFHSELREVDLATLRALVTGLSKDGKMPAGAPDNILRLISDSMEGTSKVDLSATWTNEFLETR